MDPTEWKAMAALGAKDENLIYLVTTFTNLALCYEKMLKFRSALGCMTRAAMFMPDSQKVEKMRVRLAIIVKGFEDKVINLDDFDKSYYHSEEQSGKNF